LRIKYLQFFQVNQNVFIKTRKSESSIVNEFALINRTLFRLLTLFGALAPMTITHPSVGWPAKIATFLATSLCSSALIRLVARTYDSAFSIPVGVVALLTGIVIAWFALRRWRRVAPLRCWALLGLCAGFGGAGLVMLLCHTVVYLTTPVGAMRSL